MLEIEFKTNDKIRKKTVILFWLDRLLLFDDFSWFWVFERWEGEGTSKSLMNLIWHLHRHLGNFNSFGCNFMCNTEFFNFVEESLIVQRLFFCNIQWIDKYSKSTVYVEIRWNSMFVDFLNEAIKCPHESATEEHRMWKILEKCWNH